MSSISSSAIAAAVAVFAVAAVSNVAETGNAAGGADIEIELDCISVISAALPKA